jgi:hypothetical protein
MLHVEFIIIGLCLWSIYLHIELRRYETGCNALRQAIIAVADGEATVSRVDGAVKIQTRSTGVK